MHKLQLLLLYSTQLGDSALENCPVIDDWINLEITKLIDIKVCTVYD